MGEVIRQRRVRADSKDALLDAARRECDVQQAAPSCERVLVVYGAADARIYVESTMPPPRTSLRRSGR